ncbi:myosin-If [Trichinella spiralis]|uniref:myosin-If n=1 Tax=Trichinella spiralis TaxID=6334 RepID=UPI0001EFDF2C|nr:myosin-If [Trichinella spiralis]
MEVGFVAGSLPACMPAYLLENDTVAVFLCNDELRIIFAASIGPDKSISLFVLALPSNWQSTGYSLHTVKNRYVEDGQLHFCSFLAFCVAATIAAAVQWWWWSGFGFFNFFSTSIQHIYWAVRGSIDVGFRSAVYLRASQLRPRFVHICPVQFCSYVKFFFNANTFSCRNSFFFFFFFEQYKSETRTVDGDDALFDSTNQTIRHGCMRIDLHIIFGVLIFKHLHWQWHGIDQVGVHDMVLLATVDEDAIVQNLRKRYMNSIMFVSATNLRETNIFCPIRPQQPYESFRWSKMAHDAQHFAHGESSSYE